MDTMELLSRFSDPETLQTLTATQRLMAGLVTTILGMGITFVSLVIVQFVISLMARFTAPRPAYQPQAEPEQGGKKAAAPNDRQKDEELVAAITVALAMQLQTATSNIVIRNIKRIEDRTPAWSKAGLAEQMNINS